MRARGLSLCEIEACTDDRELMADDEAQAVQAGAPASGFQHYLKVHEGRSISAVAYDFWV